MKFNSQICTNKEQSERLLDLGLKKETADMCINYSRKLAYTFSYSEVLTLYDNYGIGKLMEADSLLPAWSLHRLIEILGVSKMFFNMDFYDAPYEEIIRRIDVFIKTGVFNREYLEGK